MADTNLSQAIDATDGACFYDTNIKFLLADKQVLARILKYAVREFKDMSVEDIMSGIGDDIKISKIPLDAGLSNLGRVKASGTEDNIPGEGKIFFDIRFTVYHKEKEMKFLINLEAQRSSRPGQLGYHLENRIVFYLARMISAQKYTEFFKNDYDSLKKVRSIWICLSDDAKGDSIEEIYLDRRTVYGSKKVPVRGQELDVASNFSNSAKQLRSQMEMQTGENSFRESITMCEVVQKIKAEGRAEGLAEGRAEGLAEGRAEGLAEGRAEGLTEGRAMIIEALITAGLLPKDFDMESVEEFPEKQKETEVASPDKIEF